MNNRAAQCVARGMFVNPLVVIALGAHAAAERWRAERLAEAQMRSLLRTEMLRQLAERTRDEARLRERAILDARWTWWRPKPGTSVYVPSPENVEHVIFSPHPDAPKREIR